MNFSRFREAGLFFTNLAKPVTQKSFEILKFLLTFYLFRTLLVLNLLMRFDVNSVTIKLTN